MRGPNSILGAVHQAVASGNVLTTAEGGMKFSLMTHHDNVTKKELEMYRYVSRLDVLSCQLPRWS